MVAVQSEPPRARPPSKGREVGILFNDFRNDRPSIQKERIRLIVHIVCELAPKLSWARSHYQILPYSAMIGPLAIQEMFLLAVLARF